MARKRRRFTAEFKARVALEALRERDSVQAIARRHELHPNQVSTWKRQLLEGLPEVFAGGAGRKLAKEHEAKIRDLHAKIGSSPSSGFFSARAQALSIHVARNPCWRSAETLPAPVGVTGPPTPLLRWRANRPLPPKQRAILPLSRGQAVTGWCRVWASRGDPVG